MQPTLTLADIFGTDSIFNARPSYRNYGWLPTAIDYGDAATGVVLTVAGEMPTICSQAVVTPVVKELLAAAGLPVSPPVLTYDTRSEYEQRLKDAARKRQKIAFQYVHAPHECPDSLYLMPHVLLSGLNDKANLPYFVPAEHVPSRHLVTPADLPRLAKQTRRQPLVLKAAGPQSSGSGDSVFIALKPADVLAASRRLGKCKHVVVEQFLKIKKNYCLNFATISGTVRYLGGTEQITNAKGTYCGNWLDKESEPPRLAIDLGHEIMRRAVARGYRGVGGFDIIVNQEGAVKVIDLNFRLNGSTTPVIWRMSGCKLFSRHRVARFATWHVPGPLARHLSKLHRLVDAGELLPLAVYDPAQSANPAGQAHFRVVIFGRTRREIESKQSRWLLEFHEKPVRSKSVRLISSAGRRRRTRATTKR